MAPPTKRLEFIDLLRGWAVVVMIETHIVSATILPAIRLTNSFRWVNFVNGLVAPSFLFAAGLAFAVTQQRRFDVPLAFGLPLFKQLGRLLFLIAVGYLLQLPRFNFAKLVQETTRAEWLDFFQTDVLQCIGVSLLLLFALRVTVRNERRMYGLLLGVAVGVVLVSPAVWGLDALSLAPAPIAQYLNGRNGSQFPLFPWAAFLFFGAICGYWLMQARARAGEESQQGTEGRFMGRVTAAGLVLSGAALLVESLAASRHRAPGYWRYSPSFFWLRLGLVMMLCAAMFFYERRRGVGARSPVTLIGRRSLLVYATHLLLIYGKWGTFGFRRWAEASYGYGEALLASVILLLLMYLLALGWDWVRRQDPRLKLGLQLGALVTAVVLFFFGKGS